MRAEYWPRNGCTWMVRTGLALVTVATLSAAGYGAERIVLGEEFTATW